MKILYDHQIFFNQKYGGISRYFFELIKYFEKEQNISWDLALRYSNNEYLINSDLNLNIAPGALTEEFCFGLHFAGKAKIHRILTKAKLANHPVIFNKSISVDKLNDGQFDVFHPTYYDPYFYRNLKGKPFVLTIYDMIHELYSGIYFKKYDRTIRYKKFLAEKADQIIAISENTKSDIIKLYGLDEKKISVVHLGSSLLPDESHDEELSFKYILFVGDRRSYKNFDLFFKAISPLLIEDRELYLICAGSASFNQDELKPIDELNLGSRVIHKIIKNDSTLTGLYKNALCFVFPSLYEGFGIPVLEAFSCGCPAVLSNSSSLSEIGDDAAAYFDPEDVTSIYSAVKNVIYDKIFADNLRRNGFERLEKFSWAKCAIETKKIYEKVLGR